jgi:hypothetical protein
MSKKNLGYEAQEGSLDWANLDAGHTKHNQNKSGFY